MHFDILVPLEIKDKEVIYNYGKQYLQEKNQYGQPISSQECKFCHVEQATAAIEKSIMEKGYYIIEMQGCE